MFRKLYNILKLLINPPGSVIAYLNFNDWSGICSQGFLVFFYEVNFFGALKYDNKLRKLIFLYKNFEVKKYITNFIDIEVIEQLLYRMKATNLTIKEIISITRMNPTILYIIDSYR